MSKAFCSIKSIFEFYYFLRFQHRLADWFKWKVWHQRTELVVKLHTEWFVQNFELVSHELIYRENLSIWKINFEWRHLSFLSSVNLILIHSLILYLDIQIYLNVFWYKYSFLLNSYCFYMHSLNKVLQTSGPNIDPNVELNNCLPKFKLHQNG